MVWFACTADFAMCAATKQFIHLNLKEHTMNSPQLLSYFPYRTMLMMLMVSLGAAQPLARANPEAQSLRNTANEHPSDSSPITR
jgi:hypothetical protein